jgi:hypothetical protein
MLNFPLALMAAVSDCDLERIIYVSLLHYDPTLIVQNQGSYDTRQMKMEVKWKSCIAFLQHLRSQPGFGRNYL